MPWPVKTPMKRQWKACKNQVCDGVCEKEKNTFGILGNHMFLWEFPLYASVPGLTVEKNESVHDNKKSGL